jgi:hypothetical protein
LLEWIGVVCMIYTMCKHIMMKLFASTFALLFALLLRNEYYLLATYSFVE